MESNEFRIFGSVFTFPQVPATEHAVSSPSQPQPPIPAEAPATVHRASSSSSTPALLTECFMYKNRLQEFAHKENIALPTYRTVNVGSDHVPRFRSTVWFNGTRYTSKLTFPQRKAAEQDVARIALESHSEKITDRGFLVICEDILLSKSILNEYAAKLNLERPIYNSIQLEGGFPRFVTYLVFNGTKYAGDAARNKKEAEQLAAHAAILSILGNSGSRTLYEIIKSKSRTYDVPEPNKSHCIHASPVSAIANTRDVSISLDHKDKEVAGLVVANNNVANIELPVPFQPYSELPISGSPSSKKRRKTKKKAKHAPCLEATKLPIVPLNLCQEFQVPKHVASLEATKLSIAPFQPASEQPIGDSSSSKKRRNTEENANMESQLKRLQQCQGFQMPKNVPSLEATELSIAPPQQASEQPMGDSLRSKKRGKNEENANKESQLESPLAFPLKKSLLRQWRRSI